MTSGLLRCLLHQAHLPSLHKNGCPPHGLVATLHGLQHRVRLSVGVPVCVQLQQGRWDEVGDRGGDSSGSEADAAVPAVRPANLSKKEWEMLLEARELQQGAFAFDK